MEFVKYIPGVLLVLIVCAVVVWRWAIGIDYMHKNHPDYKGEDFLDWGDENNEDDKNQIM
jgi:hypothetical protein